MSILLVVALITGTDALQSMEQAVIKGRIIKEEANGPRIDETQVTEYLPEGLKVEPRISMEEFERFQNEMDFLTSPKCQAGPSFQPNICEWGFGSTMNSIVKPVMHAMQYGYCLKDPKGWDKYNCTSWTDVFAPVSVPSSFNSSDFSLPTKPSDPTTCAKTFSKTIHYNEDGQPKFFFEKDYHDCCMKYSHPEHGDDMVPDSLKNIGFFGSVSLILHRFLRPSPRVLQRIEHEMLNMGWPKDKPVLGLHFRAGDACLEEEITLGRRCDNLAFYMEQVDRVAGKYGIEHIYLATDSNAVLKQLDKYPQYTFLYIKELGRGGLRNEVPIDDLLHSRRIDGCKEAEESLIDVYLLGNTQAFVGKFSSNIDRVAYSLSFAHARAHVPHISLDNTWCFDYGIKSRPDGINSANHDMFYC